MKNEIKGYSLITKIFDTREDMGIAAADAAAQAVAELLAKQDEVRMIFAAEPSQNEFLKHFMNDSRVDFTRIVAFHMDEYVGLSADAPQGFGNFLRARLFDLVPFKKVNYINGNAEDMEAECKRYTALLNEAPIDIVCRGIGENGHIAFNDPHVADIQDSVDVKLVELDDVCRMQQVHDGCFKAIDEVPKTAVTLTVPRLVRAGQHFCIVPAATKSKAVRESIYGKLSAACPATVLRICANAQMFLDKDSAGKLILGI